ADATAAGARSSRFGQQIALGTMAAFFASALAGVLAAPVAAFLHADPNDTIVLRVLVAGGGICAALSAIPVLFIENVPVTGPTLDAPRRYGLLARFLAVEVVFGLGAGSFLPFTNLFFAERLGVSFAAPAWNAGSGVGAVLSGAIRGAAGPGGYTVNLLTLVVFYTAAAALILVFFRQHVPSGDVGAVVLPAPDSPA